MKRLDTFQLLNEVKTLQALFYSLVLAAILCTPSARAESTSGKAVDEVEAKIVEASVNRFKDFMQDKNVQTAPKGPDGKKIEGKLKKTPNPDDKNPFESDLTYHDASITKIAVVKDESKPNDPNATKIEEQKAFLSPHAKIAAGGGSSTLERVSGEVDKRFEEADKKTKKKPEEGISYDGMFKETVKEVKEKDIQKPKVDPNAPINQAQAKPKDKDPVNDEDDYITISRREIRPEGMKDFQKVGTDSAQTILQSATDPDKKNDPNALKNGVLLRVGAAENLMAMFRSTLANLTQRRANKAIAPLSGGSGVGRIELDEETPNCQAWGGKARSKIGEAKNMSPEEKQQIEKDLTGMISQCEKIANVPYTTINPRYVADYENGKYTYSEEGAKTEDGIERDSRAQLEVMAKAGKSATEVESNWKYDKKDDEVTLKRYQADGSTQEIQTTAKKEIDSFNNQLVEAKKGYDEVSKRLENYTPPDPTQFIINPEEKSMMEISQAPATAMEEFGIGGRGSLTEAAPQNYDQLQNSGQ